MTQKDLMTTETAGLVEQYENVRDPCSTNRDSSLPRYTQRSQGVDKAVDLVAGHDSEPLDPKEARKIRNKIDRVVLPLLFSVYIRKF